MLLQPLPSRHTEEAPTQKIIELRALLARKFPASAGPPEQARQPTGIKSLDQCLDGGLPKAALTEVVCARHGMGSGTIIQALIESTHAAGKHLALVDAGDSFDPDGLTSEQLSALLWVRCHGAEQAVKAMDLLCRDNNLPLVVLDLMMCPERQVRAIPSTYWYRLQRVVEGNGAVALVFTPAAVVGSAACTLRLTRMFELPALDLLRDQLTARLGMETVRARSSPCFRQEGQQAPAFMVG
jgi:hypothetical protein